MSAILTVARLGAQGDGVADTGEGPVFVPFALPGEKVNVAHGVAHGVARGARKADLVSILEVSPQRIAPACRHFTDCGGCAMQHLEANAYRDWKRGLLVEALRAKGIDIEVDPLISFPPHARRRAALTAKRTEGGILLGFNAALSHRIVDLEECPVLLPQLVAAQGSGRLEGKPRQAAIDFCIASGIARLTVDGEIVIEPKKPAILVGGIAVAPPPGAFLQAVEGAEAAMAGLVCEHLAGAKRVADLFAGIGTFALRLARASEVHAVESDAAALAALDRAFRFGAGLKKVTVEKRDLFVRPLTFKELDAGFDGLAFDPPRAGAEAQAAQIARSQVRRVAAVSCNPLTLARDLSILIAGGYRLKRVVPVDQFLWSPHLEAVALLEKPKKKWR